MPWFQSAFRISLIPMHPMRMADRGGTALYWLVTAQLEVGNSCPVRSKDLPHRREQPLAPCSTPIEQWLITGICCSPCCVHLDGEAGVSSPGVEEGVGVWMDVSLDSIMWGTACCPCSMPPPPLLLSMSVMDPKEQQGHYSLAPTTLQELPGWGWVQRKTALGTPTLDFSSRFTPEAIPKEG